MSSITLVGNRVVLKPLLAEHAEDLAKASADGDLSKLVWTNVPNATNVADYIKTALDHQAQGLALPFIMVLKESGEIIGSTRLFKIDRINRSLEIGHTWIAQSWQRSFVNTESKYLLLRYAFEEMNCLRVQFFTDELNVKSQAAIARLGAKLEGVLRKERIMSDGRVRNTVSFSIVDDEWNDVKAKLESKIRADGLEPQMTVSR
jgi:RimJ/RimL family protein N-acetyltransferase